MLWLATAAAKVEATAKAAAAEVAASKDATRQKNALAPTRGQ